MDDLISRKVAIDALEKVAELYPWRVPGDRDSYSQYNEAWQDALNRANSEIEALPSAQPERKKGEWIPTRIAKPPKAGQYLVTKQQKTGAHQIATAHYNPSFDEWSGNGNFKKILAWQPLPSPYTQE